MTGVQTCALPIFKHIKDVEIIPQPHGGQQARLRAPGLRGLLMGTRVKLEVK